MINTHSVQATRGQTLPLEGSARDSRNRPVDLTGATVFMWVRPDLKADAVIKLASADVIGHRQGISIATDQSGSDRGKFTIVLTPSDTVQLVALGNDNPYIYDIWILDAFGSKYPVVTASNFDLYPQITAI